MIDKEELYWEYQVLKQAYKDKLAGIEDIYAFINKLIQELDDCHNFK